MELSWSPHACYRSAMIRHTEYRDLTNSLCEMTMSPVESASVRTSGNSLPNRIWIDMAFDRAVAPRLGDRAPSTAVTSAARSARSIAGVEAQRVRVASRILSSAQRMTRMIAARLDLTRTRLGTGIPIAPADGPARDLRRRRARAQDLSS
jgi:hypothetical protein